MGERGADVLFREDRVLLADLVNRVASLCERLDTLNRNPRARNHRFICGRPAMLDNLADSKLAPPACHTVEVVGVSVAKSSLYARAERR